MPKIPKQDFVSVRMDVPTYNSLSGLALSAKLSRAEYLRRLIWRQSQKTQKATTKADGVLPALEPVGIMNAQQLLDKRFTYKNGEMVGFICIWLIPYANKTINNRLKQ